MLSTPSHTQTQIEAYVVQKYVSNPYLIGGKKFDLRVYALVTSYSPLTVWVYRTGFTRFSASRYSSDPSDIVNTYVHLTNVAVQKTSADYNPDFGGKWEIGRLKMYLASKYVPPPQCIFLCLTTRPPCHPTPTPLIQARY